jgi:hypothetical protein
MNAAAFPDRAKRYTEKRYTEKPRTEKSQKPDTEAEIPWTTPRPA